MTKSITKYSTTLDLFDIYEYPTITYLKDNKGASKLTSEWSVCADKVESKW